MLACWDFFFFTNSCCSFISSAIASADRLLFLTAVRGGKTTMIEVESEAPISPFSGEKTAQHKPSLHQDGEVGGRGDQQKGIWLDTPSAVTGECVVVL